jgi:Pathogenicity locus
MQNEQAYVLSRLQAELAPMRGLWHGTEADLFQLGIASLRDLRGKAADSLANAYSALTNRPPDPVLRPYFAALIAFAETGVPAPWWHIARAELRAQTC